MGEARHLSLWLLDFVQRAKVAERLARGGAFDPRADRDAVEAYAEEVLVPGLVAAEVENDEFLKQTTDFAARTALRPKAFRLRDRV